MGSFKLLAVALLIILCVDSYSNNKYLDNAVINNDITSTQQDDIKIVSTFKVNARVARFVGILPKRYLKYTNQATLTVAIYSNNHASVIAVGDTELGIPLPIRIAVFQDDYTFECFDRTNDVMYCFNTSKLQ